jgi:hypothetical protein
MMPTPPLPQPLRLTLERELAPGERLLWAAQPRGSRMWTGFGLYLFAIPWTVFALFWEAMALSPWFAGDPPRAIQAGFGIVMPIFGLPFVLIGLAMLYAPIHAMRKARDTVHALTDKRLLTLVTGRKRKLKSAWVDRIGPIERQEDDAGWGSLKVQTHSRLDSEGDRLTEKFELTGIPDVARLEHLIIEQQNRR